jgi:hypothetical protein
VTEEELISALIKSTAKTVQGKHVLCLSDTTEINLNSHKERLKKGTGIGLTGDNQSLGFFMHTTLVLDAKSRNSLGYSHLKLWHRPEDKLDKYQRKYDQLPIEEKESYKWIESSLATKKALPKASMITMIEDREGDIYQQFCLVPDNRTHLLVRACRDRIINENQSLYQVLHSLPCKGSYKLKVEGDLRKKRSLREAEIEIRFSEITINKPKKVANKEIPKSISVNMVEACENNPPDKESPIIWRLITTHPVNTFEQACKIVEWYQQRWQIEQVFRLLKQKGVQIEDSELEQGWAVRKLTIMLLSSVLKIIQMHLTLKYESNNRKVTDVFNEREVACLKQLNREYEGTTINQKNNNPPGTLRWATWIIARMGGWKGMKSERSPGVLTLKWGLDCFYDVFYGWKLGQMNK